MQAIGQPDVDVDDHGAGADGPQRRLADRNGVLAQGTIEVLVEHHPVLPERRLIAADVGHGDFGLHKAAAAADLGAGAVGVEGEGAAGYAPGLLVHLPIGFPSYRETHRTQPNLHRAAELDFAGPGPDCLALKEEQYEARIASIRQPKTSFLAI